MNMEAGAFLDARPIEQGVGKGTDPLMVVAKVRFPFQRVRQFIEDDVDVLCHRCGHLPAADRPIVPTSRAVDMLSCYIKTKNSL